MTIDFGKYSHIEVLGTGILPFIQAISAEALSKTLLAKYDLENIKEGCFYPLNNYLALLDNVGTRMPTVLKSIGTFITSEVEFPYNMDFEKMMMSTDQAYYSTHRGQKEGEIGHYNCEKRSDKEFLMTVDVPYPCDFDQGIFEGMAKNFGLRVSLKHVGNKCRKNGDPECAYRIRLKG